MTGPLRSLFASRVLCNRMIQSLTDLPLLPIRVTARAREAIELPPHPGSTLRGAFGGALKELVCVQPARTACAGCPYEASCAYPTLFEPRAPAGAPRLSGFEDLPRPYVIRPGAGAVRVPAGASFSWGVVLIGRATQALPYFLLAWRQMGRRGIGPARSRFDLLRVDALRLDGTTGALLYDSESQLFRPAPPEQPGAAAEEPGSPEGEPSEATRVTVRFLTPTSLRRDGRPVTAPAFGALWAHLQRRLSVLRAVYGAGRPEIPFGETIRRAESVRLVRWDSAEVTWSRYSRRQGRRVPMRGFVGTACYEGDLALFLPALRLGVWVGVGDNCTFGQGVYELLP